MSEQKTSLFEESLKPMKNVRAIDTGQLEFIGGAKIG
jgi:hypothetical protein